MSERQKQILFLKQLATHEKDSSLHELQDEIAKAEKEEKCVRSAAALVALIGLVSALGLGYSTVVLEDIFRNSTNVFMKLFSIIGLGSLICLVGYVGYWLRRRTRTNQLYDDIRTHIISISETRILTQSALSLDTSVSILDDSREQTSSRMNSEGNSHGQDYAQAA